MTQRAPEVGEQDVRRILSRDYPEADIDEIRTTIGRLEVREKWRVVLACLKNGAGVTETLQRQLGEASGYYREIISEAEYPRATKLWSRIDERSEAEQQAIFDEDWQQYHEWLGRM